MSRPTPPLKSLALLAAVLCAGLCGQAQAGPELLAPAPESRPAAAQATHAPGKLTVIFFDIGQGDAALVISPAGKTVLIDGGPAEAGRRLAARLKQLVRGPLDLVVMTHPHADHLGGLADAVRAVGARRFLEPGFDHPSTSYRRLLEVLGAHVEQKLFTADPARPEELIGISLGEGVKLWLLWPRIGPDGERVEEFLENTRSDVNANSVVAKLVYGKTSFLLVGDAEPETEEYLLQKNIDFSSTVLKVGHHGGRHSSTAPFLSRVRPKAAIISVGSKNEYGHPGAQTLWRLSDAGARIFRTDRDGEVTAVSDGLTVRLSAERASDSSLPVSFAGETAAEVATGPIVPGARHRPDPVAVAADATLPQEVKDPSLAPAPDARVRFVASRKSRVFHQASCAALGTLKAANRLTFTSRAEAARGRQPAGDCNP